MAVILDLTDFRVRRALQALDDEPEPDIPEWLDALRARLLSIATGPDRATALALLRVATDAQADPSAWAEIMAEAITFLLHAEDGEDILSE